MVSTILDKLYQMRWMFYYILLIYSLLFVLLFSSGFKRHIDLARRVAIIFSTTMFVLIPFVYVGTICPCPMRMVEILLIPSLINATMLAFLISCILGSLLVRGLWCGWICPVGSVQELMARSRAKFEDKLPEFLRFVRYIFPAVLLMNVVATGSPWICSRCFISTPMLAIRHGSFSHSISFWVLSMLGVLIFALSALSHRFFCRYVCPSGPLLELIGRISLFRVEKTQSCRDCTRCVALRNCPMNLKDISGKECTSCLLCLSRCPFGAVRIRGPKSSLRRS